MTNDGELTNQLTHPRFQHEKEYLVQVSKHPQESQLNAWRKGIILDDGSLTLPAEVWIESRDQHGTWLGVILKEGKNRQIRRMGAASDLSVLRIIRIRIANLQLGDLAPGEWRDLTTDEIRELKASTQ
jgi:23S rRNA pseudouridine2605 synthase